MTVFKTFLKILKKNKTTILLYTIILLSFGTINMTSNSSGDKFEKVKPDVLIINNDENKGITKNLIKYIEKNSNIVKIDNDENKINDALFYQEIQYVIYIPENYNHDFFEGINTNIKIKKGITANSSFAEIILKRYLSMANTYRKSYDNEKDLLEKVNETLDNEVKIEMTNKVDTNSLQRTTRYYNFASYSFLACLLFVICLILASFKEEWIYKRTIISSMNYKKYNRILLLSNFLYSIMIWLFYVVISFILFKKTMFSNYGLIYLLNSFVFVICSTSLAFLIGSIVKNKNAINGIVNIIALGSAFLCGAFVPTQYLPDSVLKIAHISPAYYYINNNEILINLKSFSYVNLKPVILNIVIMLSFMLVFIVITNIFTKKRRSS